MQSPAVVEPGAVRSVSAAALLRSIEAIGSDESRLLHLFVHVYIEHTRLLAPAHYRHAVQIMPVFGGWRNAWLEFLHISALPGVDGDVLHCNLRWHDGTAHPAFVTRGGDLVMHLLCDTKAHGINVDFAGAEAVGSGLPRRRSVVSVSHTLSAEEIFFSSRGPVHGSVKGRNNERKVSHISGVTSDGLMVCERYDGCKAEILPAARIRHFVPSLLREYYCRSELRWTSAEAAAIRVFVAELFCRAANNDAAVRASMQSVAAHGGASSQESAEVWNTVQCDADRARNLEILNNMLRSFEAVSAEQKPLWAADGAKETTHAVAESDNGSAGNSNSGGGRDIGRGSSVGSEGVASRADCEGKGDSIVLHNQVPNGTPPEPDASHPVVLDTQGKSNFTQADKRHPASLPNIHGCAARQRNDQAEVQSPAALPSNVTDDGQLVTRQNHTLHHVQHDSTVAQQNPPSLQQLQQEMYERLKGPQLQRHMGNRQERHQEQGPQRPGTASLHAVPHPSMRRGPPLPRKVPRQHPPVGSMHKPPKSNAVNGVGGRFRQNFGKGRQVVPIRKGCNVCGGEDHTPNNCPRVESARSQTQRERALLARLGGSNQQSGFQRP
jgi:hypothetical protein